jgi:type 1 glutamine amidotransferase
MRSALLLLAACGGGDSSPPPSDPPPRVLVYTATFGFRHFDAIEAVRQVLPGRLADDGITVELTEDALELEDLSRFDAVMFAYTTGNDIVTAAGRVELEAFIRGGGGFIGIHSATDTEYLWPFYQELILAPFASHPNVQPARVRVEDSSHPSTAPVPAEWNATDEWYNFAANPRAADVRVLLALDEASYTGGTMGADHPIAWAHERFGGRAFYTGLGHAGTRWSEPEFVEHIAGGVAWAIGEAD